MTADPSFAQFVQPSHYRRSDGATVCAHNVPVRPAACPECHSLTDEHWDAACTCDQEPSR